MTSTHRPVGKLREHPLAALVPEMSEEEFLLLCADAGERGILDPVRITAAGVVLDGRHRLRAARELGLRTVPVRVVVVEGADETAYMVRAAALRRQLSSSQKAAMAVELADYERERERGRARQRANLRNSPLDVAELPPRGVRARDRCAKRSASEGASSKTRKRSAAVTQSCSSRSSAASSPSAGRSANSDKRSATRSSARSHRSRAGASN